MTAPAVCNRPACLHKSPPKYSFELDPFELDEPPVVLYYCALCVAFCITQDYFTASEVHTLHKL